MCFFGHFTNKIVVNSIYNICALYGFQFDDICNIIKYLQVQNH